MIPMLAIALGAIGQAPSEETYYAVDYLEAPAGARLEVGGMDFLPDGRLVVSTRRGQVWIVENPLAKDPKEARFHLFAEGLQEGLGLAVVHGTIHVLQRAELSALQDRNGDGTADVIQTHANDWGVSGHYHEFAFGLPRDAEGNFYITLNVSFGNPQWWHGRSVAPHRGWAMKISPQGDVTPFASGLRSPAGLGTNAAGDLFYTDNQGDWVPACPIHHLQEGRFYGHPASLNWTAEYKKAGITASDTVPPPNERADAAVWIPYDWSRSAGALAFDPTNGKFGPFANQMFVAELTNGMVLRAMLEKVGGEYLGAVIPFRQHVGSAVRLCFAPDGTLFTGFTDRGWGGQPPGDGIARIRWTGATPMEIENVRLVKEGFEIEFTKPIARSWPVSPELVSAHQYDYDYWWEYGSPTRHVTERVATALEVSEDRTRLTVRFADLAAGMVMRMRFPFMIAEDGSRLLHDEFAYTVNRLIDSTARPPHVAKLVQPPRARERWEEGALTLARDDVLDIWKGTGWQMAPVELDPSDPSRLRVAPPPAPTETPSSSDADTKPKPAPVISNLGPEPPTDLVSELAFGDADIFVDFMLPKGGRGAVFVMDRYKVSLRDHGGQAELTIEDSGGIGAGESFAGSAPKFRGFRSPGEWHGLDIRFQAPRFNEHGRKIADARFTRVMIDDVLLQENVDVPGPTHGGAQGEVAFAPLRLVGTEGNVAFRNISARPRHPAAPDGGKPWTPIFDGQTLEGWQITDSGQWKVEDGAIVGRGTRSHLFTIRGDFKDHEVRARVKVTHGSNSGLYFRTAYGPGWPSGYEAQVNSTHEDPVKTGSLYGLALVKARLVAPDVWFTYHVKCVDEADGVHITIKVNDIVVTEYVDQERKHASGHIALQQHHDGSVVYYRDIEVREL